MSGARRRTRTALVAVGVAALTVLGLVPAHATPAGPRQPVAAARSASPSVAPVRPHPGRTHHPAVVRTVVTVNQPPRKHLGSDSAVLVHRAVAPAPVAAVVSAAVPVATFSAAVVRPPARSPPASR